MPTCAPEVRDRLELLGRERALIYKTLLLCGLRKGELTALTVTCLYLDSAVPCIVLNPADEKNRQGSEIVLRDDLAADLRDWLADKLERLQSGARASDAPIPARLPSDTSVFVVPDGLLRIFNRDLKMAGIAKRDERGRTLDVHAMRTTLATLLGKGGVAMRTAQAAMRHSDPRLTAGTYTDPKLLDVRGALDVLPPMNLNGSDRDAIAATGTDLVAPTVAPTPYKLVQPESVPVKVAGVSVHTERKTKPDATSMPVNRKDPLTTAVSGSCKSGQEDLNLRPHGPEPCALAKLSYAPFSFVS